MAVPSLDRKRVCLGVLVSARLALLLTALASPLDVAATQDDVRLPLPSPEAILSTWSDDDDAVIRAVDVAQADMSVGVYVDSPDDQRWFGRVGGALSFVRGRRWGVGMGLSAETVMDTGNGIAFRLIRLYYEAPIRVDVRLGPGILTAGFRHRCSHGVDGAVEDRILIRSSLEVGYLGRFAAGPLWLSGQAEAQLSMIGQNIDRDHQPRGLLTLAAQLDWPFAEAFGLVASSGLGIAWIGRGGEVDSEGVFLISDAPASSDVAWLPAATLGVAFHGRAATTRLLLHFQRTLDSGVTRRARPTSLTAVRLSFDW